MHWQAKQFVAAVLSHFPEYSAGRNILEIGSADVNGTIRDLFDAKLYTGIDLSPGPGVDVISSGHEYQPENSQKFDLSVSCECFEHNPYYAETLENMADHTKEEGLVVFTCASTGRPEHGTSRTDPSLSPGSTSVGWDYYKNLVAEDFSSAVSSARFKETAFFSNSASQDLYFIGTRGVNTAKKFAAVRTSLEGMTRSLEQWTRDGSVSAEDLKTDFFLPAETLGWSFHKAANSPDLVDSDEFWSAVSRCFERTPRNAVSNFLVCQRERRNNRPLEGLRFIERALQIKPGSMHYKFIRACCFEEAKLYGDAAIAFRKIFDRAPNPGILLKLSAVLLNQDKVDEAEKLLSDGGKSYPDNPHVMDRLGAVWMRKGRTDQALALFEKVRAAEETPDWLRQSVARRIGQIQA